MDASLSELQTWYLPGFINFDVCLQTPNLISSTNMLFCDYNGSGMQTKFAAYLDQNKIHAWHS